MAKLRFELARLPSRAQRTCHRSCKRNRKVVANFASWPQRLNGTSHCQVRLLQIGIGPYIDLRCDVVKYRIQICWWVIRELDWLEALLWSLNTDHHQRLLLGRGDQRTGQYAIWHIPRFPGYCSLHLRRSTEFHSVECILHCLVCAVGGVAAYLYQISYLKYSISYGALSNSFTKESIYPILSR